jgi:hypothetical protein
MNGTLSVENRYLCKQNKCLYETERPPYLCADDAHYNCNHAGTHPYTPMVGHNARLSDATANE